MNERIAKYEVLEKIAEGGFGTVYKARDPFIKRLVAIKTCSVADQDMARRFFREAEIAGRFDHPNVTIVHDFGVEDQLAYLVQEYLPGEDLLVKIRRRDPLPMRQRVDYLLQVAAGLAYAHSKQVIHRDIKPANLRVLENGQVKILDFGIAKLATATSQLTQKGVAIGTLGYLSPEQLRDQELDIRTDIFSFGVVAYELITYAKPFQGRQLSVLMDEILNRTPVPVTQLVPDCPPALEQIVDRCLEKDRERRYQTFEPVIGDLEAVRRELGSQPFVVAAVAPAPAAATPAGAPSHADGEREGGPITQPIPLLPELPPVVPPAAPLPPLPAAPAAAGGSGTRPTVVSAEGTTASTPAMAAPPPPPPALPRPLAVPPPPPALAMPGVAAPSLAVAPPPPPAQAAPLLPPLPGAGSFDWPTRVMPPPRPQAPTPAAVPQVARPAVAPPPPPTAFSPAPVSPPPPPPPAAVPPLLPDKTVRQAMPPPRPAPPTPAPAAPPPPLAARAVLERVAASTPPPAPAPPASAPSPAPAPLLGSADALPDVDAALGAAALAPPPVPPAARPPAPRGGGSRGTATPGIAAAGAASRSAPSRAAPTPPSAVAAPAAPAAAPARSAAPGLLARRWPLFAAAAAVLLLLVVLGAWLLHGRGSAEAATPQLLAPLPAGTTAAAPAAAATVLVLGTPWGELESLRAADGRELPLPQQRETPLLLTVPPGHYTLSLRHPGAANPGLCEVDAVVGQAATCKVELLPLETMQYFKEAGWWR
ncbi:MAG TPA: serine/threonine-protein kinase [Thermoanaerobaculia bacterium]|nr:serine/threonine-protein kinase [Thermoanaerobaculia bacterium]